MDVNCVIVDAADPERLAAFWSELLDRPVVGRVGPYVWLARKNGLGIGFQRGDGVGSGMDDAAGSERSSRVGSGKNRLHLDLESADPRADQARAEALGARRLTEYDAGGFLVMADPEGNEFCIIPTGPFEIDDEGRASYLTTQG